MPYGIRPSNVRVCHFTTRAFVAVGRYSYHGFYLVQAVFPFSPLENLFSSADTLATCQPPVG